MAITNPPPIRGISQELQTFLRQLWLKTGGSSDPIADAQVESFTGVATAQIQALAQELDHTRCQLSAANGKLESLRSEIDYLQIKAAASNAQYAALTERINNIEVKAWL